MNSKTLAFLITLVLLTSDLHAVEVSQPAADAPVVAEVDLLVVGGSVRGVVAAEAAARAGAKTMLVTPLNYLGDVEQGRAV